MNKITAEELKQLSVARPGRRHPVSVGIEGLDVGEILYIPGSDWKDKKRTPSYLVKRAEKALKRKYNFLRQTDVKAWVVERVV